MGRLKLDACVLAYSPSGRKLAVLSKAPALALRLLDANGWGYADGGDGGGGGGDGGGGGGGGGVSGGSGNLPVLCNWSGHLHGVSAFAFSPDGRRLAVGNAKGEVVIVDARSVTERVTDAATAAGSDEEGVEEGKGGKGAFDPSAFDPSAVLARARTQRCGITSVAWSADGSRLVVGGADIVILDASSGKVLKKVARKTSSNQVACSLDGDRFVAMGSDGKSWPSEMCVNSFFFSFFFLLIIISVMRACVRECACVRACLCVGREWNLPS
ncbi:hypothetical protein T492DRAFT_398620 [Pavlovales sp. CCMP2436]|nr:hypothetical protein T492DRAFT_398620 [Pavlovales sp. CCMP2436]